MNRNPLTSQRGSAKIAILGVLALVAVVFIAVIGKAISVNDNCVSSESGAIAAWAEMKNVRDNAYQQITSQGGVVKMERESFESIMDKIVAGRSHEAAILLLAEQNPDVQSATYLALMETIEARLNDWKAAQTRMISHQQSYRTYTQTAVNRMFAGPLGFPQEVKGVNGPTQDLDGDGLLTVLDYPVIITAATAQEFSTSEAQVINPFGN